MRVWLSRLVDLREGEARPAILAFITLFGVIAGHTALETARDALFLEKLPPHHLAFVYALLAGVAFTIAPLSARIVRSFGRRYALITTLLLAAFGTTLLYFEPKTKVVVFILYIWSGVLGTLMAIQFWMLAGELLTLSQGKRLFGPIAAGGALGATAGAGTSAALLELSSVDALLLLAASLFIGAALVVTSIRDDDARVAAPPLPVATLPLVGFRALFRDYPYLARMAALVALSTTAVLATDYLFKSVAAGAYQGRELGAFFARYYAALNGISLLIQLGIASRLIKNTGVFVAVTVLPLCLILGSADLLIAGGALTIVLLTKGADGALRHSLNRVATELLWLPVAAEGRERGKALLEGVLARIAQAIVAVVILGLAALELTSPRVLAGVILAASVAWVVVALGMRLPYLDLLRQAIRRGTMDPSQSELDLASVEAVLEALSSREPDRVLAAMDLLVDRRRSRLIPALVLYHEAEPVLIRALQHLTIEPREDWVPLAERLLEHPSEAVRVAVVRAFAGHGRTEQLRKVLGDPSPAVRAHAAFCLAHCDSTRNPRVDPTVAELLALDGDAGRSARIALLSAIRDHADTRWSDLVLELAQTDDAELVEEVAATMTKLADDRFIPFLVRRLGTRSGRGAVRDALVALGAPALDALESALADPATPARVRLHVPRTISRFGNQRAADILVHHLTREPSGAVRYKVLRGLGRLVAERDVRVDREVIDAEIDRNLREHLRMLAYSVLLRGRAPELPEQARASGSLLFGLVADKAEHARERAFRLLQIAHRREDIRSVYLALGSTDRRTRANAQEYLDVLSGARYAGARTDEPRELCRIVADDLGDEARVERARPFLPNLPVDHPSLIAALMAEPDEHLASLASYHALELGAEALRERVARAYEERPGLRAFLTRGASSPLVLEEVAGG